MNYDEIGSAPPGVLDKLPIATLYHLHNHAEAHAADAAKMLAILHGVLTRRYAAGLNDAGTHHRHDGGYDIKITVPKRVDWDQEAIAKAVETIKGWNENPADYVDTRVTVAENKFKAWPPALRDLFTPARTVKPGKAKFEIAEAQETQEAA